VDIQEEVFDDKNPTEARAFTVEVVDLPLPDMDFENSKDISEIKDDN
jgi:hypothetical protein